MPDSLLEELIFTVAHNTVMTRLCNRSDPEKEIIEEVVIEAQELWDWFLGGDNPRLEIEFQSDMEVLGKILGYSNDHWMR